MRTASPANVRDGIDAVLYVAGLGMRVHPLWPGSKKPVETDWPNRTTDDLQVIRQTWPHRANIGVSMRANGLVGIDLDQHDPAKNGVEGFGKLCEKHRQDWPNTFTVRTPNGLHLYFWAPVSRSLGNTSGRLAPGIDTRGPGAGTNGGYLVGPGSVVDGRTYEIVRDSPIVPLPMWLVELLDPPRAPARSSVRAPKVDSRYLEAALTGEIQRVLDCGSSEGGGRNNALNTAAFSLGQLVGAGLLNTTTVETALLAAAEAVCLVRDDGYRQVRATIASGLNSGMLKPRIVRRAA